MRCSDKGSCYLKIMPFIAFLVQTVDVRGKKVIIIIMQLALVSLISHGAYLTTIVSTI